MKRILFQSNKRSLKNIVTAMELQKKADQLGTDSGSDKENKSATKINPAGDGQVRRPSSQESISKTAGPSSSQTSSFSNQGFEDEQAAEVTDENQLASGDKLATPTKSRWGRKKKKKKTTKKDEEEQVIKEEKRVAAVAATVEPALEDDTKSKVWKELESRANAIKSVELDENLSKTSLAVKLSPRRKSLAGDDMSRIEGLTQQHKQLSEHQQQQHLYQGQDQKGGHLLSGAGVLVAGGIRKQSLTVFNPYHQLASSSTLLQQQQAMQSQQGEGANSSNAAPSIRIIASGSSMSLMSSGRSSLTAAGNVVTGYTTQAGSMVDVSGAAAKAATTAAAAACQPRRKSHQQQEQSQVELQEQEDRRQRDQNKDEQERAKKAEALLEQHKYQQHRPSEVTDLSSVTATTTAAPAEHLELKSATSDQSGSTTANNSAHSSLSRTHSRSASNSSSSLSNSVSLDFQDSQTAQTNSTNRPRSAAQITSIKKKSKKNNKGAVNEMDDDYGIEANSRRFDEMFQLEPMLSAQQQQVRKLSADDCLIINRQRRQSLAALELEASCSRRNEKPLMKLDDADKWLYFNPSQSQSACGARAEKSVTAQKTTAKEASFGKTQIVGAGFGLLVGQEDNSNNKHPNSNMSHNMANNDQQHLTGDDSRRQSVKASIESAIHSLLVPRVKGSRSASITLGVSENEHKSLSHSIMGAVNVHKTWRDWRQLLGKKRSNAGTDLGAGGFLGELGTTELSALKQASRAAAGRGQDGGESSKKGGSKNRQSTDGTAASSRSTGNLAANNWSNSAAAIKAANQAATLLSAHWAYSKLTIDQQREAAINFDQLMRINQLTLSAANSVMLAATTSASYQIAPQTNNKHADLTDQHHHQQIVEVTATTKQHSDGGQDQTALPTSKKQAAGTNCEQIKTSAASNSVSASSDGRGHQPLITRLQSGGNLLLKRSSTKRDKRLANEKPTVGGGQQTQLLERQKQSAPATNLNDSTAQAHTVGTEAMSGKEFVVGQKGNIQVTAQSCSSEAVAPISTTITTTTTTTTAAQSSERKLLSANNKTAQKGSLLSMLNGKVNDANGVVASNLSDNNVSAFIAASAASALERQKRRGEQLSLILEPRFDKKQAGAQYPLFVSHDLNPILKDLAQLVRKHWKCNYIECSAASNWNINPIISELTRTLECNQQLLRNNRGSGGSTREVKCRMSRASGNQDDSATSSCYGDEHAYCRRRHRRRCRSHTQRNTCSDMDNSDFSDYSDNDGLDHDDIDDNNHVCTGDDADDDDDDDDYDAYSNYSCSSSACSSGSSNYSNSSSSNGQLRTFDSLDPYSSSDSLNNINNNNNKAKMASLSGKQDAQAATAGDKMQSKATCMKRQQSEPTTSARATITGDSGVTTTSKTLSSLATTSANASSPNNQETASGKQQLASSRAQSTPVGRISASRSFLGRMFTADSGVSSCSEPIAEPNSVKKPVKEESVANNNNNNNKRKVRLSESQCTEKHSSSLAQVSQQQHQTQQIRQQQQQQMLHSRQRHWIESECAVVATSATSATTTSTPPSSSPKPPATTIRRRSVALIPASSASAMKKRANANRRQQTAPAACSIM